MTAGSRYFAFLSYSHADRLWADWLHRALEAYRVPSRLVGQATTAGIVPRRLIPIFRDRDELASSSDLSREVNAALDQSSNLIVICSPRAVQSRWVNEEILSFESKRGRDTRIFCLIVDGEPNATAIPGREADECLPPALRHTPDAPGASTPGKPEPIAADARPGKDGRANAKLKLIAGLLGVGFDTLKQRELQRRHRRLATVTALALVVTVLTSALAIEAVIARNDARRRQKQAEELVGFMVGDLSEKLREVERLDILQAVDDKAMTYFASLSSRDVTDAALTLRVDTLQRIGGVRQDQGQIPEALQSFTAAAALAAELLRRSPLDLKRQANYANCLTWVGKAYWYQGDLVHAGEQFSAAVNILQTVTAAMPDDTDLSFKLSAAMTNSGRVLEARGQLAAAEPYYEGVKKLIESLVKRDPGNPKWQLQLGNAYDSLGKLALGQGRLDVAIGNYRASQRIQQELADLDKSNHNRQYEVAISNAILGRTLALCGELNAAEGFLRNSVERFNALTEFDASQTEWLYLAARYNEQLASVLRQQRQLDAAARAVARSLSVLESLIDKDPTDAEWQQELARSRLESARLLLGRRDSAAAAESVRLGLTGIEQLRNKAPDDRNLLLLAAQAHLLAGQIAQAGDEAAAREHWEVARTIIASNAARENDPNFLSTWAITLLLLGDTDAAVSTMAQLANMGYQSPDFLAIVASRHVIFKPDPEAVQRIASAMNDSRTIYGDAASRTSAAQ